ncbi:Concanavalin A-like lectin family protein [Hirschfeldia incana]|nr:Concanavalin A-like lectin family protein [Hirschfeldia incana]
MPMFKALSFLFVLLCFHEIHGTMARNYSFSFDGFPNSPSLDKKVALFGDSKLVSDISSIQLTDSVSGSVGGVFYRKPINLFQGKESSNSLSFSSYFSFSMPNEISDVMAFVMVPTTLDLSIFGKKDNSSSSALEFLLEYAKNETVVAFEFDISNRGNRARILIGKPESSEIRNLSFVGNLMVGNGGTLNCMVEYEALSKRMTVRFRKPGSIKLFDPFFDFSVDLGELWNGVGEFVVGLISANGDSSNAHFLRSWNFEIRQPTPVWTTSVPVEPNQAIEADVSTKEEDGVERDECIWRMLGVLVLGAVCGALGVMLALYLWTICGQRRSMAVVVPEECHVKTVSVAVGAVEEGKK